jgi:hypothetical protein
MTNLGKFHFIRARYQTDTDTAMILISPDETARLKAAMRETNAGGDLVLEPKDNPTHLVLYAFNADELRAFLEKVPYGYRQNPYEIEDSDEGTQITLHGYKEYSPETLGLQFQLESAG